MKNNKNYTLVFIFLTLTFPACFAGNAKGNTGKEHIVTDKDSILREMQPVLEDEFRLWYPLTIDSVYGGFFSDVNYKWQLEGKQNKFIVTQARHIWSASNGALFNPEYKYLLNVASHGFSFLKDKMWDNKYGGFFDLVNRKGEPFKEHGGYIKRAYGNAFALYALAEYYKASGNEEALQLAKETFKWFEKCSYDSIFGGYFQFVSREGKPFKDGFENTPPKDYNSSIHILESFTALYKIWPDQTLMKRLSSLLFIIRDTITDNNGDLTLFFQHDWTPVSYKDAGTAEREKNYEFDHVSFGHDVETAYLMLEACEVLGMKNDPPTLIIAKKMVDHAIETGMDSINGGLFDGGYYFKGQSRLTIIRNTKEWWSQAEALNSFLMMSKLYPDDKLNYYDKFCKIWNYIKNYLIDKDYGGWYWGGIDIIPQNKHYIKASIWKANYHTSRALVNCIKNLRSN